MAPGKRCAYCCGERNVAGVGFGLCRADDGRFAALAGGEATDTPSISPPAGALEGVAGALPWPTASATVAAPPRSAEGESGVGDPTAAVPASTCLRRGVSKGEAKGSAVAAAATAEAESARLRVNESPSREIARQRRELIAGGNAFSGAGEALPPARRGDRPTFAPQAEEGGEGNA